MPRLGESGEVEVALHRFTVDETYGDWCLQDATPDWPMMPVHDSATESIRPRQHNTAFDHNWVPTVGRCRYLACLPRLRSTKSAVVWQLRPST